MRVLLDTNVLLDVIARREGFYADSAAVWSLVEAGKVEGYVSAISFNNLFYVVERLAGAAKARRAVRLLRDIFQIVPLTADIINGAIDSRQRDFEDAIQMLSAAAVDADALVTRNLRDFHAGSIQAISPTELIARLAP